MRTSFRLAVMAAFVALAPCVQAVDTIVIDVGTALSTDGVDSLQAINGLVVNGESRLEHCEETRALQPSSLRLYLWVDLLGAEKKTLSHEQAMDKFAALDFDKAVPAFFDQMLAIDPATGKRRPQDGYCAQFWQLEQLQAWGARRNIILQFAQPHPRSEADFAAWSRYFRACVREVKRRYPDLGPLQVMLFNEPDYEYPRQWDARGLDASVTLYCGLFRHVEAELRKEFPDVTLLGPGISQFMRWDTWRNWTLPFLKQAPEANYFNCQPYCWRFTDLLSWTEALQSASLALNGKKVPLVATETNVDLDQPAADWWSHEHHEQRVRREAAAFMGMLTRPDLFAMKEYFFYHYTCGWHDMWFKHDGVNEPAPVYWLYWLLRDVEGTRLLSSVNPEGSPLAVVAAVDGQTVTAAVFNDSGSKRLVKLEVRWPEGVVAPTAVREFLRYDTAAKRFVHGSVAQAKDPDRLEMAAGELVKIRWVASPTAKLAARTAASPVFRAKEAGVTVVDAPLTVRFACRQPATGEVARLRLALYVDDPLGVDHLEWRLNGHEMSAPFAVAPKTQPILSLDMAVPSAWLKADNSLELLPVPGATYRLMFAALVLQPLPDGVVYQRHDRYVKTPTPLAVSLALPPVALPGPVEAKIEATNKTDSPAEAELSLVLPEGWRLIAPLDKLKLPARGSVQATAEIEVPAGSPRGERFVAATLAAPGLTSATARRGAVQHVPFQAEMAERPPKLDGDLGDWNPRSFVVVDHAGPAIAPHRTRTAAKWDAGRLYLALDVQGRKLNAVPPGGNFWAFDTLELFLDFPNAKKPARDHRCMQTWVSLKNGDTGKASWGNCPNDPNGVYLKGSSPGSYQAVVAERADGFSAELSFDWKSLTDNAWLPANERLVPGPGKVLGCDVALANRPILGDLAKHWNCPARWGLLELLPPQTPAAPTDTPIAIDDTLAAAQSEIAVFSPAQTDGWSFPLDALDDNGLRLRNHHALLLLDKPLENVLSTKGTTFELTLGDAVRAGDAKEKIQPHARIFLTPGPLGKFIEPYSMKDAFCLIVAYREGEGASLQFSRKTAAGDGWGNMLWTGSAPASSFPLRVSLHLDQGSYRLAFSRPVETSSGAISGPHGLPPGSWTTPSRFGVTSCYGKTPADITIKEVTIK